MDFSLDKVIYIHTTPKLKNGNKTSLIYKIQLSDNHTVQKIDFLVMGFFYISQIAFQVSRRKPYPKEPATENHYKHIYT